MTIEQLKAWLVDQIAIYEAILPDEEIHDSERGHYEGMIEAFKLTQKALLNK